MPFIFRREQAQDRAVYRSVYIRQSLADKIEQLARQHGTSWNRVVISMIESCLLDGRQEATSPERTDPD